MGLSHYKKVWTSIFKLARTYGQDTDSTTNSREQQSKDLSDNNKEESYTRLAGDSKIVESQDRVCGYKL